jgi:hypothetical protein
MRLTNVNNLSFMGRSAEVERMAQLAIDAIQLWVGEETESMERQRGDNSESSPAQDGIVCAVAIVAQRADRKAWKPHQDGME